ncbi:MAG TPA: YdeI/OmpD-associated family protein [Candidatus Methylomirabilis sp.]|nr:YdeI/OmpD-associated family protein [Candidatus Methylomirabilis sp.]
MSSSPKPSTTQHKFKVQLLGQEGSSVAALKPPFDVVEVFQRKGRVPVKGTINGFPFRSPLMNMGEGHMMVVNAKLRAGAKCKAGDTASIVMELDTEERTVELPAYLKKIIAAYPNAKETWDKLSFTRKKEYVREIDGAKRPETRQKRIAAMMDALRNKTAKK